MLWWVGGFSGKAWIYLLVLSGFQEGFKIFSVEEIVECFGGLVDSQVKRGYFWWF